MILPELSSRVKSVFSGFRDERISLELKDISGLGSYDPSVYARNGFRGIAERLGASVPAWSGEPVTVETALKHSVVNACNRLISETIGMIPAVMIQKRGGEKVVCDGADGNPSHPMFSALHDAPNFEQTAMEFRETGTSHCLLTGMESAYISRRSGTGTAFELWPIPPESIRNERDSQGRLVHVVKDGNSAEKTYTVERGKPHEILQVRGLGWDGLKGHSVIEMGRNSIGTAIAAERNLATFFARGGRLPYVLTMEGRFKTEQDYQKFRADWDATYSDPHKAVLAEPPIKDYKQIGISAKDAQLLETRQFEIHEICRWFLVSPHLVGDLSRATFSNIEQLALEFVKMTLARWITRWEQALWRCVLTDAEKAKGFYWKHNINALLRGDFQSRMAGYATMLQNGIASVNEVRDLEDWNPIEGGDDHHIQLNQQTLPGGTPTASQMATLMKLGPQPAAGGTNGQEGV